MQSLKVSGLDSSLQIQLNLYFTFLWCAHPIFPFQFYCRQPGRMKNCGAHIDPYKLYDLMVDWLWLFNQTSIIRGLADYQMTDFSAQGCGHKAIYDLLIAADGTVNISYFSQRAEYNNWGHESTDFSKPKLLFQVGVLHFKRMPDVPASLTQLCLRRHAIKVLAIPCKVQGPTTGFMLVWRWCHGEIEVKWSVRWKLSLPATMPACGSSSRTSSPTFATYRGQGRPV